MAAALMPREMASWGLTAVALGALEGGLLGVIVKNLFADAASPGIVNLAVAVVAGAPAFTNLSSFLFASLASGRDKLALLSRLMQVIAACLLLMAIPGSSAPGLILFCVLTVIARTAWSGILTIRAAVWRANYQRQWRGQVTARIVQLASLLVASYAALIGFLLDWREQAFRPAFIFAAGCCLLAAYFYRRARVRRHRQLLAAEKAEHVLAGRRLNMSRLLRVLQDDRDFRRYMISMMIFGSGNLMILPILVVILNDRFELTQLHQVMVLSSLPLLVLCFCISYWARLLDRRHIFSYRAIHSWTFVASFACYAAAVIFGQTLWLWPASVILGAAYAGAHLGWNLGHNDFSSDASASHYMAIHVTLTGLRGLFVPLLGVGFYQLLVEQAPAQAPLALLVPLALSTTGACTFVYLHRERERRIATQAAGG